MRAIWTGSVSFGLINVPVKLFSGSESSSLDLKMLHEKDLSPIRYAKICRQDGKEIPFDEIVKGYEYQKGDYIVLTDEDFKAAAPKQGKTIEIAEFVDEDEIDIRYYEKPYYLEPDRGADKQYALLREALRKSKKVAVAKYVLRNREHLAVIKTVGPALVMNQMRFPQEVRQPSGLNLPDAKQANKKELDLALALVDQLTTSFIPEDFHDEYTAELEHRIQQKIKGKKPKKAESAPQPTGVTDLMSALKASLEQSQKNSPKSAGGKKVRKSPAKK